MPRNTIQEQTQERQAFLLQLFRTRPDINRQDASESYKEKFGSPLPPRLFNQMKEQVQEELSSAAEAERAEALGDSAPEGGVEDAAQQLKAAAGAEASSAAQQARAKAKAGKGQRHVFVDAPKESLVFLERLIGQLQEAGASNVRIDHSTDRWMVLVVDGR